MKDAPLSLRISVTDRCQLRCVYCMPPGGVPKTGHDAVLSFEEIVRFVRTVRSHFELTKVRITGGDPLARSGIVDLVAMLAAEGVGDLALTTNGQRLAETAGDLKRAGLRRVNVSLDSLDEGTFAALTRGGRPHPTLEGIQAAVRAGLTPVKLNTVVLRGLNDTEVVDIARFGLDAGCEVRFLELMPIGCAGRMFDERFVPTSEVRVRIEEYFTLSPLTQRAGGSSQDAWASDAGGRSGVIGFISATTQPFCAGCTRLRLTSTGRLVACLARGDGPDVRRFLSGGPASDRALREIVAAELAGKRARAEFETAHSMAATGG